MGSLEVHGTRWMVSTHGTLSSQIGNDILNRGGNVIDAAIAASLALCVERSQSTGVGGGGFLIYHEAKTGKTHAIDFRERAPAAAHANLYLDADGNVQQELAVSGGLATAVPGQMRGFQEIHRRFGKLPWNALFEGAIHLAREGVQIYTHYEIALKEREPDLKKFAEGPLPFFHPDGEQLKVGDLLIQEDLARSLEILAKSPDDLNTGELAKAYVAASARTGGVLTLEDLANYQVRELEPISANWNDYKVISMPPPSSGGIHVIQVLKLLESDRLKEKGFLSAKSFHLIASALQQAFADRAEHLGDPEFCVTPSAALVADAYLKELRSRFHEDRARTACEVSCGEPTKKEPDCTSHVTVMDADGNAVVTTHSINGPFGARVIASGTGIFLNNTMYDFSAKPGHKNLQGTVSMSDANSIAANKTPLSSMCPTLVLKNGRPVLALGAQGGTKIISAVAQVILNHLEFKKPLGEAVSSPRIHQQWSPDEILLEPFTESKEVHPTGVPSGSDALALELQKMGWVVGPLFFKSNVFAVSWNGKELVGSGDPRDIGRAVGS